MKSRDGKSNRREEERGPKKRQSEERRSRRAKRWESREALSFQWFVAPEGRKEGSLKRRARSNLARWEMTNCTPLWREAHVQVKKLKATFGSWHVEKVHAAVVRSKFPNQNVQSTSKQTMFRPLLEVDMSKKCTQLWPEAHFEVKMLKAPHVQTTFGRSDVVSRGRRKGLCTCSKVSKTWRFCSVSKNDGRRGTFQEDLERCISRGRRSTRDMFIRDVRRSGCWFPEKGCILEHQIFGFGKMILRDRCSISYDLASIFRGRRSTLDRWTGKITKRIGTRLSALHSTFHFWRKSLRIVSFLMLSTSKIEEVSQISFVFKIADRQTNRQTDRQIDR